MSLEHDSGASASMSHIGEWVRYADAKAGLATAGFAAVVTIIAAQMEEVTNTIERGGWWASVAVTLAVLSLFTTTLTLWFLVDAVVPRPRNTRLDPNRFAWPAVAALDLPSLQMHVSSTPPEEDAWAQAKQLADIAKQKYDAVRAAMISFLFMTVFGVALVSLAGVASGVAK